MKISYIRTLGNVPQTPAAVQGLTATVISSTEIDLTWTGIAGAQNYTVRVFGNPVSTQPSTGVNFTMLAPATQYSFTVAAINALGEGPQSAPVLATTQPAAVLPGPITGLTASAVSPTEIDLSWVASTNTSSYNVTRGGVSVGNPTGPSFNDTGLNQATTYNYTVTGLNNAGVGQGQSTSATTPAAETGTAFVFTPGNRVLVSYQNMPSLASIKSTCDSLFGPGGADINNQIKGICIPPTWAQLEGPTLGQYDGFALGSSAASENGITKIKAIISLLKSYNPPRDLTIKINGGGNGYSSISSTAFQNTFCPAYMNSSTYGGGEVHIASNGTPLDRPYIVIWNQNVVNREIALIQAYNTAIGPDTPTGGIYRWDPYQEISINASAPGYSVASISAIFPSWMAGIRNAAPNTLIMVKPTFINPSDGSTYGSTIVPAMFNNHISMSCEDCAPLHDWGMKAYLGMWASTTVNHTTANGGNPDWDYHCNVDPAELWQTSNNNAAIPPAHYGPGLFYDGAPTNPGIMTTVNQLKASHVDWYIDAFGGPNVVRSVYSSSAPANPTPGPGAGLIAAHPNIRDVLTANLAYAGMQKNGLAMPWTQYPSSYP